MCDAGTKLYSHFIEERRIRLYFSSLGQVVGATIDGQYNAFSDLEMPLKVFFFTVISIISVRTQIFLVHTRKS
jgi:hypothetical protein